MSAAVQMQSVCKAYQNTNVVDQVTLEIRKGEFFTLLGPSGSGKTTTLKMLAGLEMPTGGEILIETVPVTHLQPHQRNIGMVFQSYALFPHMTVFENIAFPLKMRRVEKSQLSRRVREVLAITRLDELAGRYPRQLSGGQQQRVALARAFVYSPAILLMDEPLGALDRNLRDHMRLELKRLQRQIQATVLYVTHDQDEALAMSDRIGVMQDGKLLQVAEPNVLYEKPVNAFVATFIGESVTFPVTIEAADDQLVMAAEGLSDRVLAPRVNGFAAGHKAVMVLRPEKLSLSWDEVPLTPGVNRARARVEDVVYMGQTAQVFARTAGGAGFLVRLTSTHRLPAQDEEIFLTWRAEHTHVVHN